MHIPSNALSKEARSRESLAMAGVEVILAGVDKLTEHAVLSSVLDAIGQLFGRSDVSQFVLAHYFIVVVFLGSIWVSFVYWRAGKTMNSDLPKASPQPISEPPNELTGAKNSIVAGDIQGSTVVQGDYYNYQKLRSRLLSKLSTA